MIKLSPLSPPHPPLRGPPSPRGRGAGGEGGGKRRAERGRIVERRWRKLTQAYRVKYAQHCQHWDRLEQIATRSVDEKLWKFLAEDLRYYKN